jgi:hypothetical protein
MRLACMSAGLVAAQTGKKTMRNRAVLRARRTSPVWLRLIDNHAVNLITQTAFYAERSITSTGLQIRSDLWSNRT